MYESRELNTMAETNSFNQINNKCLMYPFIAVWENATQTIDLGGGRC